MKLEFHDGRTGEIPDDRFLKIQYVAIVDSAKGLYLGLGIADSQDPNKVAMQGIFLPGAAARWLVRDCIAMIQRKKKPAWLDVQ